ncbi:MAG: hypothetical protein ACOY94_15940 [Bacillota bacterium]
MPLAAMERFLLESLPVAAVAHSYHVEALRNPILQRDPAYQRFSLIELNELHHQIAAYGDLIRMQQGDPTAADNLAFNLAGFLQNRQAAMRMLPQLSPAARSHPAMQRVMGLMQVSNQQVAGNNQLLNQTFAMTDAPVPGPLLVRPR